MGGEDYYLELCERPVQFEKANPVNCVFFDEANKQVSGARSEAPRPDASRRRTCRAHQDLALSARCFVREQRRVCNCTGGARVRAGFQMVNLRVWPACAWCSICSLLS